MSDSEPKTIHQFIADLGKSGKVLPYQAAWIRDKARLRIANKARQTRFSTTLGLEAVLGLFQGVSSLIVSSAERNAQEVLDKCTRWLRVIKREGVPVQVNTRSKSELSFGNGAKILSLAQNPDTVRGFAGNVYLDEFAHHSNDKAIYEAIFPAITAGYRIAIISTPLGESGLFYDIWANEAKYRDYTRHKTTIYDARDAGLPVDVELLRRNMDEDSFRQEYLCEFIDESTAYFPYALIRGCIGETVTEGGQLYAGVDIGRKRDLTVVYVVRKLGERLYTEQIEELKGQTFEVQRSAIRNILTANDVKRCRVDETGLGMQLAEELKKEFHQVEPVTFNNESKERMAVGLKRLFESGNVQIPDNQRLISDIHAIRKEVTVANNVRFDAERTSAGHADRFWALALAADAARVNTGMRILFSA